MGGGSLPHPKEPTSAVGPRALALWTLLERAALLTTE